MVTVNKEKDDTPYTNTNFSDSLIMGGAQITYTMKTLLEEQPNNKSLYLQRDCDNCRIVLSKDEPSVSACKAQHRKVEERKIHGE